MVSVYWPGIPQATNLMLMVTAYTFKCQIQNLLSASPIKDGTDYIYGHDATHKVSAIEILSSTTTSAPTNNYYTTFQTDIASFIGSFGELNLGLPNISINSWCVTASTGTSY